MGNDSPKKVKLTKYFHGNALTHSSFSILSLAVIALAFGVIGGNAILGSKAEKLPPQCTASNAACSFKPQPAIPGDIDASGQVTLTDLTQLLGSYNSSAEPLDLDKDGKVTAEDLSILLSNYGR